MIIDKDTLIAYNLYDTLPDNFRLCTSKTKYVFVYHEDEENTSLKIYDDKLVYNVNESLLRDLTKSREDLMRQGINAANLKIGYLSYSNESRDGLFYMFLRTYNSPEAVMKLYSHAKEVDENYDIQVFTDFTHDILNSDDVKNMMGYFCKERIQPIMIIYDMVDEAFRNRFSRPLYGKHLHRIVQMVKYDAGVLLEIGGTLRYMVIGEKAILTPEQTASLDEAKNLLRNGNDPNSIYTKTGWGFSIKDGLWRTNISDVGAEIKNQFLIDYNGNKLYKPEGIEINRLMLLLGSPADLYQFSYRGILSDVLSHPTLYDYYPRLETLPLLFYAGESLDDRENTFYFSPNRSGGFIIIKGNNNWGNVGSILLHEVQHAIQHKEGFARGGNNNLAEFVASLGAQSVRKVFACMNVMERQFREKFSDPKRIDELRSQLKKYNNKSNLGNAYKKELLRLSENIETFKENLLQANFLLLYLIGIEGDISDSTLVDYLAEVYDTNESQFYSILGKIVDGRESAKKYEEILKNNGYRQEEIRDIVFTNYLNLYGELESRSVQISRNVDGIFRNYFYMTSWEHSPYEVVTVIDDNEEVVDVKSISAAIETKDDKYVLHFNRTNSCVPILHELGHIVYDAMCQSGHEDVIKAEYEKQVQYADIDEFFVSKFLVYFRERLDDEGMRSDMKMVVTGKPNPAIDNMLQDFFRGEDMSVMKTFLEELLKLI